MGHATKRSLLRAATCAALLAASAPVGAQVPAVVRGRVEDAVTRAPVAGATVLSPDSSSAARTDSAGTFVLPLGAGEPLALHVERIGYLGQRFDLPPGSASRLVVLRLEPAAVELEGVTVVAEQAIEALRRNLEDRRNAFPGAMRALDRVWLDRFAPIGSVFELVRRRIPSLFPCRTDPASMCLRGRAPTFGDPFPTRTLTVCIDGREAIAAIPELEAISTDDVALVEFYGHAGVKVYTAGWMLGRAGVGWTTVMPDTPFGLSC